MTFKVGDPVVATKRVAKALSILMPKAAPVREMRIRQISWAAAAAQLEIYLDNKLYDPYLYWVELKYLRHAGKKRAS